MDRLLRLLNYHAPQGKRRRSLHHIQNVTLSPLFLVLDLKLRASKTFRACHGLFCIYFFGFDIGKFCEGGLLCLA